MASPHTPHFTAIPSQAPVRHWRRGNLIGAGSFGKVNIAINMETCELFAVKSIECSDRAGGELLALENELQILQSLDSPWIVRCLGSDYTVENSVRIRNLFIEYMAGGSLADFMKKFGGQLEEPVIRVYTRYILQGLHYLHDKGVVHCDIKGKNILIGSMGAKLADFGSAKRIGSNTSRPMDDDASQGLQGWTSMKGTPLWMAPEVAQQIEQGPASDIWSLGCTIVEMATGRPPWGSSSNPFGALYKIACTEDLPPLPYFFSIEGKDFLRRCFHRDPKARWTSAQLLEHPFVSKENSSPKYMAPSSPTSILDFPAGNDYWDTRSSDLNSVPLLSLQRGLSRFAKEEYNAQELTDGNQYHCARERNFCRPEESIACTGRCLPQPLKLDIVPVHFPEARMKGKMSPPPTPPSTPSDGQWITVRSPVGCIESRQRPFSNFMLQSSSSFVPSVAASGATVAARKDDGSGSVMSRKSCDVNLDCFALLRSRRRKTAEDPVGAVYVGNGGRNERERGNAGWQSLCESSVDGIEEESAGRGLADCSSSKSSPRRNESSAIRCYSGSGNRSFIGLNVQLGMCLRLGEFHAAEDCSIMMAQEWWAGCGDFWGMRLFVQSAVSCKLLCNIVVAGSLQHNRVAFLKIYRKILRRWWRGRRVMLGGESSNPGDGSGCILASSSAAAAGNDVGGHFGLSCLVESSSSLIDPKKLSMWILSQIAAATCSSSAINTREEQGPFLLQVNIVPPPSSLPHSC